MKALWLREVRAIQGKKEFLSWWQVLTGLIRERSELRSRHEELLAQAKLTEFRAEFVQRNAIDTLYRAGEMEDSAASLMAESSEVENKAYEAVANFESQRIYVSGLYSQMGAEEHRFLSLQSEVEKKNEQMKDAKGERFVEVKRRLAAKTKGLKLKGKDLQDASDEYEREADRKMRLWEEVELMWFRSTDINLKVAERQIRGRCSRKEAEKLFKEAELHKQTADRLNQEADKLSNRISELKTGIEQHRSAAKRLFGCLVGEEFLYWPRRENNKQVYCMPIGSHSSDYNIELKSTNLYIVNRQKGVSFIEPLGPDSIQQSSDDNRLNEFFVHGRE
jgi:Txe/YoeB family toxin of Txe-Axe toxin-antitoxin module